MKNCHRTFYGALAESDIWADMNKLAADTSVTRVCKMVGIACMIDVDLAIGTNGGESVVSQGLRNGRHHCRLLGLGAHIHDSAAVW